MKKALAACVGTLVVALLAGIGLNAAGVGQAEAACSKPVTIMDTELDASVVVLEAYIASEIAPLFKNPELLSWAALSYSPVIKPGVISLTIGVGEQSDGFADFFGPNRSYAVKLVRECAGGEWEVVKFERIGKPEPLAQKPE